MTAYKLLIVFVTLIIIGSAGYYFRSQGTLSLIGGSATSDAKNYGVGAMEVFSGTYACAKKNGCIYFTKMILQQDTTLDIFAEINEEMIGVAQGTWGIGKDGSIILMLQTTEEVAGVPRSLIAKKNSTIAISGFSKKSLFSWMIDPTFVRVSSDTAVGNAVKTEEEEQKDEAEQQKQEVDPNQPTPEGSL